MKSLKCLLFILSIFAASLCWSEFNLIENGPIHEAFVTRNYGTILLPSISIQPPTPITEDVPPQVDPQTEWIHGYWSLSPEKKRFIWISGVWRRPPPNHFWIHGFWKNYDEGWIWIKGFWTEESYENLVFLDNPPPDLLDENPKDPPSLDYFWVPGFWEYQEESRQYEWLNGKWELFEAEWVYIPTHYIWQPDGYICIRGYWDWPINKLGRAFDAVEMIPGSTPDYYQPNHQINTLSLLRRCFFYYPDYLCFFQHHYHFHRDFWKLYLDTPPWWQWKTWWCFNWHHQWAIWWWYTNPGYPQPLWLTQKISRAIPPPTKGFLKASRVIYPPFIVTPNGVITSGKIVTAIAEINQRGKEFTERLKPILPSDPQAIKDLDALIQPKAIPKNEILEPSGSYTSAKKFPKEEQLQPLVRLSQEPKDSQRGNRQVSIPDRPGPQNDVKTIRNQSQEHPLFKPSQKTPDFIREQVPKPGSPKEWYLEDQKKHWDNMEPIKQPQRLRVQQQQPFDEMNRQNPMKQQESNSPRVFHPLKPPPQN